MHSHPRAAAASLIAATLLLLLSWSSAFASNFVALDLPRGVQIQLPKGWWLLTPEHKQMIDTSVEAALDLAGLAEVDGVEVNLIAANSMPRTTYAALRIDSIMPVSGSPSEITDMTDADLAAFADEVRSQALALLPQQGNRLMDFYGVTRDTISRHPTLVTHYRRSGPQGPVIVYIVQIFTPKQDLRINLSYRESEQAVWKPVIGKIYQSIKIRPGH